MKQRNVLLVTRANKQFVECVLAATEVSNSGGSGRSSDTKSLLRESELKTNLALKKTTKQSSTAGDRYKSSNAVDGSSKTGLCTKTAASDRFAMWQVDLGAVYNIRAVVIAGPRFGE